MTGLGRRIRPRSLILLIAVLALVALAAGSASALVAPGEPLHRMKFPFQVNALLSAESRESTSVIVQNNSANTAMIVMEFNTPAGVPIPLASEIHTDVPAWSTRTFAQGLNQGLLPGFRGVGVISSDQPLNALLLREVAGPDNQRSYAIHNAHPGSGTRVALPFVANQLREGDGAILNTRFSIANAGLEVACITITYDLLPGRGSAPIGGSRTVASGIPDESCPDGGVAVAVAGQLTLAPDEGRMAKAMPAGTMNSLMSVLIDSTQPVTVAADIYRGDASNARLGSYNGFIVGEADSEEDDVSTRMIMPVAQKNVDGYTTEFAITNPWDEAITGSIVYRGRASGDPWRDVQVTVDLELPAGGTIAHSALDATALPDGFTGWAVIDAQRPVAALVLRGKSTDSGASQSPYGAVNGVPEEQATTKAKFPLIFRHVHAFRDEEGINSWVGLVVVGGEKATVTIVAVNNPGAAIKGCEGRALFRTTLSVTGSIVFDQGSDNGGKTGLGVTPTCLAGGMSITSDKPMIAIGGVTSDLQPGDNDGIYNAFP